ncbi:hypothetical protein BX616_007527 [Lobosporangium transversale]|nr:hypothetical protein BX616_007527 [Lobosporangium transversale]
MWEDDTVWLPMLLKGRDPFFGKMYFKRKGLENPTAITTTAATSVPGVTSGNVSTTMTTASFTTSQPKGGPFAMFDHHLDLDLPRVPCEIAFDGTIASYED